MNTQCCRPKWWRRDWKKLTVIRLDRDSISLTNYVSACRSLSAFKIQEIADTLEHDTACLFPRANIALFVHKWWKLGFRAGVSCRSGVAYYLIYRCHWFSTFWAPIVADRLMRWLGNFVYIQARTQCGVCVCSWPKTRMRANQTHRNRSATRIVSNRPY